MKTIKALLAVLIIGLMSLGLVACDEEEPETGQEDEVVAQAEDEAEADDEAEAHDEAEDSGLEKVEVAEEGTEFDPPVEKEQIPEGAWICDMGTVHYAQMSEGDGSCPLCGMDLVHHEETDHGHDHDHDHHDHDH